MYWAKELANQTTDTELQTAFGDIASQLEAKETAIVEELNNAQGKQKILKGTISLMNLLHSLSCDQANLKHYYR